MPDSDYKSLCAELLVALKSWSPLGGGPLECWEDREEEADLIARAEVLLDQPEPTAPTDEESDAFAIVQKRLEQLAGDQQLMIYRWPEAREWDIHHTNPSTSVQLGEVDGKYGCIGRTLEEAVCGLAEQLLSDAAELESQ
jgi:hypothetical protein